MFFLLKNRVPVCPAPGPSTSTSGGNFSRIRVSALHNENRKRYTILCVPKAKWVDESTRFANRPPLTRFQLSAIEGVQGLHQQTRQRWYLVVA